jgi:hypothetical protein
VKSLRNWVLENNILRTRQKKKSNSKWVAFFCALFFFDIKRLDEDNGLQIKVFGYLLLQHIADKALILLCIV